MAGNRSIHEFVSLSIETITNLKRFLSWYDLYFEPLTRRNRVHSTNFECLFRLMAHKFRNGLPAHLCQYQSGSAQIFRSENKLAANKSHSTAAQKLRSFESKSYRTREIETQPQSKWTQFNSIRSLRHSTEYEKCQKNWTDSVSLRFTSTHLNFTCETKIQNKEKLHKFKLRARIKSARWVLQKLGGREKKMFSLCEFTILVCPSIRRKLVKLYITLCIESNNTKCFDLRRVETFGIYAFEQALQSKMRKNGNCEMCVVNLVEWFPLQWDHWKLRTSKTR